MVYSGLCLYEYVAKCVELSLRGQKGLKNLDLLLPWLAFTI